MTLAINSKRAITGWLFIAPYILVVVGFLFSPLVYAGYLSVHTFKLVGGFRFAPLENFKHAFSDPLFLEGLKRVVIFGLIQVPIMLGIALFAALALDLVNTRLARIFRVVAFMPYAVPSVIGGVLWGVLFSATHGPIPRLLNSLGFHSANLFATTFFIYLVGNVVTWGWTGYNMIIIYSALQGLPKDSFESAVIDGANQFQIARYVKIPAIRGALLLTTIFSVIGAMQLYTEPSILSRFTTGISNGYTPNLYAYSVAFNNAQFNYSSAISITVAVIVFAVSFGFISLNRKRLLH
jgi:multiple sugar transport system permease protein